MYIWVKSSKLSPRQSVLIVRTVREGKRGHRYNDGQGAKGEIFGIGGPCRMNGVREKYDEEFKKTQ